MNNMIKINLLIGFVLITIGLLMCIFYPFSWYHDFNAMSDNEILIVGVTDGFLVAGVSMILVSIFMGWGRRKPNVKSSEVKRE
jgi:O-antigen/teichoic acid export membrane protein